MKSLVIAEKPSVARDIARALGKAKKVGETFETDEYVIAAAVGHVVELTMPEDIDPKLRFWRLEPLPIVPDKFGLKAIEKNKAKFTELKKLMGRKDVSEVINACDAGREGELIFTYLYELAKCKKPYKRLWMQSMTQAAIRKAFEEMRDASSVEHLRDAARCRSEADWLIGINGTRALTTRMYGTRSRSGNVATVGRVQTPTLAIVHSREKAIESFVPRDYWRIVGTFGIHEGTYEGAYQRPGFKKADEHDRVDRLWDKETAERVVEEVNAGGDAEVSEEKKRSKQASPRLYDLTTLQREANNRYGFPAGKTLRTAQALYERHKVLTYPRTDSRALPEDYIGTCYDVLKVLQSDHNVTDRNSLGAHAKRVADNQWVKPNKRIFNNAQISDHFAIIPTEQKLPRLSDDEMKIYDMVARRFLAIFHPSAEFDVTTRLSVVGEHTFKTEGKVLVLPGWLEVYGKAAVGEDTLPPLHTEDGKPPKATVDQVDLLAEQTKPPPRYTEATLLTAMETAGKFVDDDELAEAMKERGLGTPATRANIIDHLMNERYLERQGREILPTAKADNLFAFLNAVKIEQLTSPTMTGEWEHKLHQIESGNMTRDEFMRGIVAETNRIVERTKEFEESDAETVETDIISPTDGKPMLENFRAFRSQDGDFSVYKTIGNRRIQPDEVKELVEHKRIGPLDGFRSKKGRPFSAFLVLEEGKVKFDFGGDGSNGEDEEVNLEELTAIGTCPACKGPVYETANAFACENRLKQETATECDFRLSRNMLGKALPTEEVKKLLETGETGLIQGFRSKRTGRLFDAFLTLNDKGKIGFKFPERPKKKGATKKSAAKKGARKATKKAARKQASKSE